MNQEELEEVQEKEENITKYASEDFRTEMEGETEAEGVENQENPGEEKGGKSSLLVELLAYIAIVVLCLFVIPKYVVQRTVVSGTSMLDTLKHGDNLMVEKISYHFTDPKRFDIIVFYPYGREEESYYVKRIIGLPGETVQIVGDEIYIDGKLLEEDYGKDPMTYSGIAEEPITLDDDEYFVLGDNREISKDSRYDEVGPVERDLIEGKAVFRIYPFQSIGTVK